MVDEEPFEQRIKNWVETAGFALELRVARAFHQIPRPAGTNVGAVQVEPSKPYLDASSEKWREADVVAGVESGRDKDRRILVVAECKSGNDKPWVVFTDPIRRPMSREDAFYSVRKCWSGAAQVWEAWDNLRDTPCCPRDVTGFAIAEALRQPRPDNREDEGPMVPFRAVRQAMAAAVNLSDLIRDDRPGVMQFTLPIVVTAAPLFEVALDGTGDVIARPVDYTAMLAQPASEAQPLIVQVMTERHLVDKWVPALAQVIGGL